MYTVRGTSSYCGNSVYVARIDEDEPLCFDEDVPLCCPVAYVMSRRRGRAYMFVKVTEHGCLVSCNMSDQTTNILKCYVIDHVINIFLF